MYSEKNIGKKSKFLILIILGVLVILGVSLFLVFYKKDKIIYNKMYVSDSKSLYVEFYKDGTCKNGNNLDYCNYKIEDNVIILEEAVTNKPTGLTLKMQMRFKIIDKDNLEHFYSCFPDASSTSEFNCNNEKGNLDESIKYSINNKYVKPEKENNTSSNEVQETVKDTSMMHIEDNCYYVCLSKDYAASQKIVLTFSENSNFRLVHYTLNMTATSAKYVQDQVITGTYYTDLRNLYMNQKAFPIIFGANAGVKTQEFMFGDAECTGFCENSEQESDSDVVEDNNVNIETNNEDSTYNNSDVKYEYRYRDRTPIITYGEWSNWSTQEVFNASNIEVETRKTPKQTYKTIYQYKHFICPVPEYLTPKGNSTPYETDCSGKGYWEYTESDYEFKFGNSSGSCNIGYGGYYDYKKYNGPYEKEVCWFLNGTRQVEDKLVDVTEYRYRMKNTEYKWGNWSEWSDKVVYESENRQVEKRVIY